MTASIKKVILFSFTVSERLTLNYDEKDQLIIPISALITGVLSWGIKLTYGSQKAKVVFASIMLLVIMRNCIYRIPFY